MAPTLKGPARGGFFARQASAEHDEPAPPPNKTGSPTVTTQNLLRDDRDGVITMTFNRDDKLNAVDADMREGLVRAVRDLGDDDRHRALLITAAGRYFTSGIDLSSLAPIYEKPMGASQRRRYREFIRLMDEMEAIEKPIILAAHAPCLGFGLELACSCDFRLASTSATFGLPEVRLGVIPGSGGISRLTRLVGPSWARWVAMAGETVDADQAYSMGLVQAVWPDEDFEREVRSFVQRLVGLPSSAVGLAKLAIDAAGFADRRTSRDVDRLANSMLLNGDEHRALVERFAKRTASTTTAASEATGARRDAST
jgi:enoyl-CoA hydratase